MAKKSRADKESKGTIEDKDFEKADEYRKVKVDLETFENTVDRTMEAMNDSWNRGFATGYITAIGGVGIGLVAGGLIIRYIDKHKKS